MGLTRKMLTAMGIEAEKQDEIIEAHTTVTNGLKEQIDQYKADAEKLPAVLKELDELKAAASKDNPYEEQYNTLKGDYDKLKEEYESFKSETSAKQTKETKSNAYRQLLKKIGVSDTLIEDAVRITDIDSIELDDGGAIKGGEEFENALKEKWKSFIVTKETKGANTSTPPENNGNSTTGKAAELAKKYHENLYGKAKED